MGNKDDENIYFSFNVCPYAAAMLILCSDLLFSFKIILHDTCCRNFFNATFLFATQTLKESQGTAPVKCQRHDE